MKNLIKVGFVIIGLLLITTSCEKEDSNPTLTNPTQNISDCEKYDYGYVDFTNNSDNSYSIYIDDSYIFTLSGGYVKDDYHLDSGYHKIEVIQQEGYLLYPTTKEYTFTVTKCGNKYISFP